MCKFIDVTDYKVWEKIVLNKGYEIAESPDDNYAVAFNEDAELFGGFNFEDQDGWVL